MLPGAPVKSLEEMSDSSSSKRKGEDCIDEEKKAKYPKEVVRTDAREQKLDKFFSPGTVLLHY